MGRRDKVIEKVVKILRLAHGAGTEHEAHAAFVSAQRIMYEHDIDAREVDEHEASEAVVDAVIETSGRRAPWREYLAAVVAENFRTEFIISQSRSTGETRLVFVGRRGDVEVAHEAFVAATYTAEALADRHVEARAAAEREGARGAFLTGFLVGLYTRFQENVRSQALVVLRDRVVLAHAQQFVNAGEAAGGGLETEDPAAMRDGFEAGHDFGDGTRRIKD